MRKSFIFLAFILVFAFGQGAFAQNCLISISDVDGLTLGGNIQCNKTITVTIAADASCLPSGTPTAGYSPTNGFLLYSDPANPLGSGLGGHTGDVQAGFGQVGGGLTTPWTNLIWDFGPYNNYFLWQDTGTGLQWIKQTAVPFSTTNGDSVAVMWGGVASDTGHGIVYTYNDDAMYFTFKVPDADSNKTVCIDSSGAVPGAVWKWAPVDVTAETEYPDWSGKQCYATEYVPNVPPEVVNCDDFPASFDHCAPATFTFVGEDPTVPPDPITGFEFEGPGGVVDNGDGTFTWTWNPIDQDADTTIRIRLSDNFGTGGWCEVDVIATNGAPVCGVPGDTLSVSAGTEKSQIVTGSDDCDVISYSILNMYFYGEEGLDPESDQDPVGGTNVVAAGDNLSAEVFFTPDAADKGIWRFEIQLDDGDKQTTCDLWWEVIIGGAYGVEIEKIEDQLQGNFTELAVNLTKMDAAQGLGGFDLLIAYDPTCLIFSEAIEADGLYGENPNCGWEYFTYRFGPYGNCGNACPSGLVQVVGMAETNDGANHPNPACIPHFVPFVPDPTLDPPTKLTMFYLKFLVSNDRTFNCQYCPVRFFWYDCTNNALSNEDGSILYTSVGVYDWANPNPINSLDAEFPTYQGAQEECYTSPVQKLPPEANVDFYNGGVDIICSDSIDAPGDININGIPYEIADAVMFTNYFIEGLTAFGPDPLNHQEASIAASDANLDGVPLTVSDLVYLIRVVVGDALPYAKVGTMAADYSVESGVMSVDAEMGAAFIVAEGNVTAAGLGDVHVQQGLVDGNTHILVTGYDQNANTFNSFSGDFLQLDGNVISVEFAAADGSMVNASNVPQNFEVFQNYPNPFNPTTKITFNNPSNKAWSVTIYNITGQRVDEFSGENGTRVTVDWDASNLASGIYFYKVVAGDKVDTKKAVLLK
jgi:hypothetical protein